jgi:hypothetical protein
MSIGIKEVTSLFYREEEKEDWVDEEEDWDDDEWSDDDDW